MEDLCEELKKEQEPINLDFWVEIALSQFKRNLTINFIGKSNEKVETATNKKNISHQ